MPPPLFPQSRTLQTTEKVLGHCYENASHLSSSGNFSFRWEAKASPTPKEVFSFIVVRLARANSEA